MRYSAFWLIAITILLAVPHASAQTPPNTINTIAGGGAQPTSAKSAYLPQPFAAVGDTAGNTYIAVPGLSIVYKVDSSGTMTIFAGNGIMGFSGDGGPAAQAELAFPTGLAIDTHNNLFIADSNNNRIRRVDTTGTITTVAGSEDPFNGSFGGDGTPATNARLNGPQSVAVDNNDDLFIADSFNGAVRRVDGSTQIITTIAGGGKAFGCPSGPGSGAGFNFLIGIAVDGSGNVYASDINLDIVCKITPSGQLSTYAGQLNNPATPGAGNGDGGPAIAGLLLSPTGLATDASNNLYITDSGDPKIRVVDAATQHINTYAGDGFICGTGPAAAQEPGCGDGGGATSASFDFPRGVSVNTNGTVLVADTNNMRVRLIAAGANPAINALAGGGSGGDGGPATNSVLGIAQTLIVDGSENVFALETSGERVRKIAAAAPNDITTVAGTGVGGPTLGPAPLNGDGGPATSARFVAPVAIAQDSSGNFYIADRAYVTVRVINNQASPITVAGVTIAAGDIATIAGNGQPCGINVVFPACGDGGPATSASLEVPTGVAVDGVGNVYISDSGLNTVRVVNSSGTIRTFAGTPGTPCTTFPTNCGDGGPPASALLNSPYGVVTAPSLQFEGATDVFIADSGDNAIREVAGEFGTISTVAFTGLPSFGGDGGSALSASMNFPQEIAVDELENIYVSGGNNNVVRRIGAFDQLIFTVAGDTHNLGGGFSGDGGPSTQSQLENFGAALAKTTQGTHDLFIADSGSNHIRKVNLSPVTAFSPSNGATMTFPNTLAGQISATQSVSITNNGLDDVILSNLTVSNSDFQLINNCNPITTTQPISVGPPFGFCALGLIFEPPLGTAAGTILTATLSFTTNDAAHPSYTLTLMGTVTAPVTLTVSVVPSADGQVIATPTGSPALNCPTNCVSSYATGDSVTLIAIPNAGFAFSSWDTTGATGASCPGPLPICVVPMTKAQTVVANFVTGAGPGSATITVTGFGNGSGTITSSPTGITCTITSGVAAATGCSAKFPIGTPVMFMPAITGNSIFAGWLGTLCSTANVGPCNIPAATSFVVGAAFSGPAQPYVKGQVFLSTDDGMVFVYNPDGSISQVLNSGTKGGSGTGMAFDTNGNLFLVNNGTHMVEKYTGPGSAFSLFGAGFTSPYSVALDPLNNVYIAQVVTGQGNRLLEFAGEANGAPTSTFFPAYESDSTLVNWFDLLSNGDTIEYTLGTNTVKEFDLGEQVQHPDLETNLTGAYALRVLPDGSVLVANTFNILRLDGNTGNPLQTYTIPGTSALFQNLNLDPDGQTFWTVDQTTGKLYRVNLASGAVVAPSPFSTGLGLNTTLLTEGVGGIAVEGTLPTGSQFALNVSDAGTGTGTATSQAGLSPAINCSDAPGGATTCSQNYSSGTSVTLTATPATGSTFAGWSGGCTNTTGTCTVTMSQVQNVTATFNLAAQQFTLTVATSGGGSGTITTQPGLSPAINCSVNGSAGCSASYASGQTITLTANAASGSAFGAWTLSTPTACVVSANTCTFTMPASAEAVTAQFNLSGSPTFTFTTLPNGALTVPYGADIQVTGGTPPYTFALQSGSALPTGFTLLGTGNGTAAPGHVFNDSPAATGTFTFGITVTDSASQSANATISLAIGTLPNTQPALLKGQYSVLITTIPDCGSSGSSCPTGSATEGTFLGSLNFDGIGGATGVFDGNTSGKGIQQNVAVTGTYTVGPDGRGFLVIPPGTVGNTGIHAAFSVGGVYRGVASAARITGFRDDDGNHEMGSGFMVRQDPTAFNPGSLAGTYVAGLTGQGTTGERVGDLVMIAFDNALNVVSGSADINDAGTMGSITSITGTYTAPDTNGRLVLSLTSAPAGPSSVVIYIISANQAVVMTLDPRATNPVVIGTALRQTTPGGFSPNSLAGPDVASLMGAASGGGNFAGVALLSVSGSTLTINLNKNDGGNVGIGQTGSGSYTLAASGKGSFSVTGTTGNGAGIFYLSQQDTGFLLVTDTSVSLGPINPQVGGPFSSTPIPGNIFFGNQEALPQSEFSGIGMLVAGVPVFNLTDDESHEGGNLFYAKTLQGGLTYSASSTGIFSGHTGDGGQLVGYFISPFQAAIFGVSGPTSDPAPSVHPSVVLVQTIAAPPGTPSPRISNVTFSTPVAVGSSAQSSPITITNTGLGPLGISGTAVPPDFSFSSTSTCIAGGAVIIQPGGTCTIIITFAPAPTTQPGALEETLTATTDGTTNIIINATGTVAAANTFTLSVTGTGTGSGTVKSQTGLSPAITCTTGSTTGCSANYSTGTAVTLTATAAAGSVFGGFSNNCTPPNPQTNPPSCILTIGTANVTVTATFTSQATHFRVSAPATATAGTPFSFTVTAQDASNQTVTTYAGTVHFTSTDEAAVLPADSTLTNGVGTFSATLNTNGGQTITATDTRTASITGVSATITVSSSPVIITVAPPPPGQPAVPTIDPGGAASYGLVLTSQPGFSGTVTLSCTSSAPQFITCNPDPASVTIKPGGTTQVAIVLNTFCSRNAPLDMPVPAGPVGVLIVVLTALALGSVTWIYRRRPRWVLTFAALTIAVYSIVGCGSTPKGTAGATPANTYTLDLSFRVNGGPPIPGPILQLIVR